MSSIDSSVLTLMSSLVSSANNGTTDIVSTLYSTIAQSSSDPVASLIQAEKNQPKAVANQEKEPATKLEIDHFRKAVAKATDLKSLLADPIARKVLLTANGLGSQVDYTALAYKALSSDPAKTGNFASKLSNQAWLAAAKTYDFANKGLTVLKQSSVLDSVVSGYAEVKWRESLDQSTPGLSNALDFRARASTMTSAYQILGDANIREVVTVALGIPKEIAYQPLDTQARAITSKLDITKLKDPKFVEQFARRYLVQNNLANQTSNTGSSGITSLFSSLTA